MADDWAPGDLALCVHAGAIQRVNAVGIPERGGFIRVGMIYVVSALGIYRDGTPVLHLEGDSYPHGRNRLRFVKISPHAPDAEDLRTIALLNGKPVREHA